MNKSVDWEAMKAGYLDGLSLRALGEKHGVSHVTVKNKVDEGKWERKPKQVNKVNKPQVNTRTVKHVAVNHPVKRGAPTVMTDEIIERLMDLISCGHSARSACLQTGVAQRTLWNWLEKDAKLMQQYAHAKESSADYHFDEVLRISADRENDIFITEDGREIVQRENVARSKLHAEAHKWAAMVTAPKKYGEQVFKTVEGNSDKPIMHSIKVTFVGGNGEKVINPPKLFQIADARVD